MTSRRGSRRLNRLVAIDRPHSLHLSPSLWLWWWQQFPARSSSINEIIIKCKWIKIGFRRKAGIISLETRWLPQLCLGVWDPWSIERWMRKRTTRDWKVVGRVVSSYVVTRYWCGTWTLCWQTIIFKNVFENWKVIRLINRGKRRMAEDSRFPFIVRYLVFVF
jgi:hypothetical protein